LGQKTPDVVYKTAMGGGAMIVDKYPRAVAGPEVPAEAEPGQRRPAAIEVEYTA
jgi:putative transposase